MKIEKLDDLLTLDTDSMRSQDKSRLLTRIKQLIKTSSKREDKEDKESDEFENVAIGIVGSDVIEVRFDLDSKKARVAKVIEEKGGRIPVAGVDAINLLKREINKQRRM